jgi:hypothetical protein
VDGQDKNDHAKKAAPAAMQDDQIPAPFGNPAPGIETNKIGAHHQTAALDHVDAMLAAQLIELQAYWSDVSASPGLSHGPSVFAPLHASTWDL